MKLRPIPGIYHEPIGPVTFDLDKFDYKNNYGQYDIFICGFMRLPGYQRAVWSREDQKKAQMGIYFSSASAAGIDIYDIPPKEFGYSEKEKQVADTGICPKCHAELEWINLAMVCKKHGVII